MLTVRPLAGSPADALRAAAGPSSYLARLCTARPDLLERLDAEGHAAAVEDAIAGAAAAEGEPDALMTPLRRAKQAAHLSIAAGDLSGAYALAETTGAMTRFADAAVASAFRAALTASELSEAGFFVVALGKMGAGELNYSSDADVAVFFDPDRFDSGARSPGEAASRAVRNALRCLEERTAEGYVLRMDLRLRPDPSSTPPAVSTKMASIYYETVGQNWERMVWIKARRCAGDAEAAAAFLARLDPYVWRRHLDYWAIADIHAIKRQINAQGPRRALDDLDPDLKLGAGGIREIEFFVQTQQLILGGRNPALRPRDTLSALAALVAEEVVEAEIGAALHAAYDTLRAVEHRIQMLNDEQTHRVPSDPEARAKLAALCGLDGLQTLDAGLRDIRERVNAIYADLFALEERQSAAAAAGNLVFTGVDEDPGTVATLSDLGFSDPGGVIARIRDWHRGGVPATRTARGRELLTALTPGLLQRMGETGEPDRAFQRFADFFSRLSSGVQTLSMLLAEPKLMRDLVETLALAPRLAATLGQRPDLLEPLLEGVDAAPLRIPREAVFETAMDLARRHHREQTFLIGHRLQHREIEPAAAARLWSDLADRIVVEMAAAAARETEARFGPPPGRWCVCALGRLGGRDLTDGSDLDLIVVYDPHEGDAPQAWFTRFTQRLISALSAPTGEGELYEVDMRLRPSGGSGPVAVRKSAFERYHRDEAWTWEHMALTRLRPLAGDLALQAETEAIARVVLAAPRDAEALRTDILDMRRRLARDRPGRGLWDLKRAPGGLVDIEFTVQHALLAAADQGALRPNTAEALAWLAERGAFGAEEAATLSAALDLQQRLQQVLRLAVGDLLDPATASAGLKRRLTVEARAADFAAAETALAQAKKTAAAVRCKKIGPLATEAADDGVQKG